MEWRKSFALSEWVLRLANTHSLKTAGLLCLTPSIWLAVARQLPPKVQHGDLWAVGQNLRTYTLAATASWSYHCGWNCLSSAVLPSLKWERVASHRAAVWKDLNVFLVDLLGWVFVMEVANDCTKADFDLSFFVRDCRLFQSSEGEVETFCIIIQKVKLHVHVTRAA